MKIKFDKKTELWLVIEKQMLNDMKLHKIIIKEFVKRCDAIKFIEDNK